MTIGLYLLAEADGAAFAVPAGLVDSVVTRGETVPVPLAPPCVAGLTALRSRVITVIDSIAAIEGVPARADAGEAIIVVTVDGHLYGLAVDDVHDVVEHEGGEQRIGAAFSPGWRRVSTGVVEIAGKMVVVVDPALLLTSLDRAAA